MHIFWKILFRIIWNTGECSEFTDASWLSKFCETITSFRIPPCCKTPYPKWFQFKRDEVNQPLPFWGNKKKWITYILWVTYCDPSCAVWGLHFAIWFDVIDWNFFFMHFRTWRSCDVFSVGVYKTRLSLTSQKIQGVW